MLSRSGLVIRVDRVVHVAALRRMKMPELNVNDLPILHPDGVGEREAAPELDAPGHWRSGRLEDARVDDRMHTVGMLARARCRGPRRGRGDGNEHDGETR